MRRNNPNWGLAVFMAVLATIAILVFLAFHQAKGVDLGIAQSAETRAFRVDVIDTTLGLPIRPDSFQVIVYYQNASTGAPTYFAASGAAAPEWIKRTALGAAAGSDSTWVFFDTLGNIDNDQGNGYYFGTVLAWAQATAFPTPFNFTLIDSNYATTLGKAARDSAIVSGLSLATTSNAISAMTIAQSAIGTDELASDAITAAKIADDALDSATFADDAKTMVAIRADSGNASGGASTFDPAADPVATVTTVTNSLGTSLDASEVTQGAADKVGFYTLNMGDDSAAWISGADTSAMQHLRESMVAAGTGEQYDSILVLDTSGTPAPIPWAHVTVYLDGFSGNGFPAMANAAGWAMLNLGASTAYDVLGHASGFVIGAYNMTTGSGGTFCDTLMGYDIDLGSPGSADLCRVSGTIRGSDGQAIAGAKVYLNLVFPADSVPIDTATATTVTSLIAGQQAYATTDANGQWYLDRIPNAYLTPYSHYIYLALKNNVTVPGHGTDQGAGRMVVVPAGATADIEDLVR